MVVAVELLPHGPDSLSSELVNKSLRSRNPAEDDRADRRTCELDIPANSPDCLPGYREHGSIVIAGCDHHICSVQRVQRLAQTTGFTFVELGESTVQMQVTAGTLAVHVPQLLAGQSIEIAEGVRVQAPR